MSILRFMAEDAADSLMVYKEQLMAIIEQGMKVEERPGVVSNRVFKAANRLLSALIHSLITCRPKECRSVPPSLWNDPDWQRSHYDSWGKIISVKEACVEWREPSEEGLQWASDLTARYLSDPVQLLREYINSKGTSAGDTQAYAAAQMEDSEMRDVNGGPDVTRSLAFGAGLSKEGSDIHLGDADFKDMTACHNCGDSTVKEDEADGAFSATQGVGVAPDDEGDGKKGSNLSGLASRLVRNQCLVARLMCRLTL